MIDPKSRAKILKADIANIIRKVKAGKPLTKTERDLVLAEDQPEAPIEKPAAVPSAETHPRKSSSIAAAVADLKALGLTISKDELRQLKRDAGAAAGFEASNRVNLDLLIPFLRARNTSGDADRPRNKLNIDIEIAEERLRELRRENELQDGKLFEKAKGAQQAAHFLADVAPMLDQKLCNEYPAQVAGLSVEEIRKIGRSLAENIKAKIRAFAETFQC